MVSTKPEVAALPVGVFDSRHALVGRVISSTPFAKSERLSSFLTCVCDLALSGRAGEINEQKIGTMLFGRSAHYDVSIDGIVRTQASRLRQRLDLYFSGEGANEPVRIVLPRGSYVPLFEQRTTAEPIPPPALPDPPAATGAGFDPEVPGSGPANRIRSGNLAWILVAVLAVSVLFLVLRNRGDSRREASDAASAQPLWSLLFLPNQRTMVVPGDSGLVMWQGLTKKKIGLADYLTGTYRSEVTDVPATSQVDVTDLAKRRYTSIVDAEIVSALTHISDTKKSRLDLRYARDLRPNDLKEGNLVLIGAAAANPWVEVFEPGMNFVFSDALLHQYTVLNRRPIGAEPLQWTSNYDDVKHRVYGVVAFLPNLGGKGNVLILEGTSMPGTESAWDFVSDDSLILPFLAHIKRTDGSIPHFQVVLGTDNMNGSSVKSSVLAWGVTD